MIPLLGSLGFGFRLIIPKGLPSFVQHSFRFYGLIQDTVGSRKGISPSRSHRTVREDLPSYGSSSSVTSAKVHLNILFVKKTNSCNSASPHPIVPLLVVIRGETKLAKPFAPPDF